MDLLNAVGYEMRSDASNVFLLWSLESDRGGDGGAPTNTHLATKFFIPFIRGEQVQLLSGKDDLQFAISCHFHLITSRT
jgi:hypothetical protein